MLTIDFQVNLAVLMNIKCTHWQNMYEEMCHELLLNRYDPPLGRNVWCRVKGH